MSALGAAASDEDADTIAALKDRVAYLETLLKAATAINSVLHREPLTDDEISALRNQVADDPDDRPAPWAFRMGVLAAEVHHGIREKT